MAAEIFILGDSHGVAIAKAADARRRPFRGGPINAGRFLEEPFYDLIDGDFVLHDRVAGQIKDRFVDLLRFEGPILSTLGFNSHRFCVQFSQHCKSVGRPVSAAALSQAAFEKTVDDARSECLQVYQLLAEAGRRVYFTCSPQRTDEALRPLLLEMERVLIQRIQNTGAEFLDIRDQIMDGDTVNPTYFLDGDRVHGSKAWGDLVLDALDRELLTSAP